MRILVLTQVLPYPPDSGPKIKTWNVLKYLARRHEVTLVSFVRGEGEAELRPLRAICRAVHTVPMRRSLGRDLRFLLSSLVSKRPFFIARDERSGMRELVHRLAETESFDAVHADQLNMSPYALAVPECHRVLDLHNALWLLYGRLAEMARPGPWQWLLRRESRVLRGFEAEMCRRFDTVLVVSEEDRQALVRGAPKASFTVIPIAVDPDEIAPVARHPAADRLLHLGTMFWPPNADGVCWFAREVLPRIRLQRPGTGFDVVGDRPPRAVRRLQERDPSILVAGYVADPTPFLESCGAFVVPLRAAGGMRVKILVALAQGLPVVTTSMGCEGLAVQSGRELLIADSAEDFARATLRLLETPALAAELGRNGRRLIETRYSYRDACMPLDAAYRAEGEDARKA